MVDKLRSLTNCALGLEHRGLGIKSLALTVKSVITTLAVSASTLLVGRQNVHLDYKIWVMTCFCGLVYKWFVCCLFISCLNERIKTSLWWLFADVIILDLTWPFVSCNKQWFTLSFLLVIDVIRNDMWLLSSSCCLTARVWQTCRLLSHWAVWIWHSYCNVPPQEKKWDCYIDGPVLYHTCPMWLNCRN